MNQPSSEYQAFIADFHAHMTRNPNDCVHLGVDKLQDDLPDPSLAAAEDEVREARALLDRARALARATEQHQLDFDAALDLELAELMLEANIQKATYTFNGRTMRQQQPTASDDISQGMFLFFINDPRPDAERLANIKARIDKVPAYLQAAFARLDAPVLRWMEIELGKVAGLPDLFANLHAWAESRSWPDAAALGAAIQRANQALDQYAQKLRAMPTTTHFHVGEDTARRIVALRGIELSLAELHDMATEFLAENLDTIETLRGRLVRKYSLHHDASAAELHKFLNQRYRVAPPGTDLELILDAYRREIDQILAFVRERDLFPVPENQAMKIVRTPRFMEPTLPAGAMQQPPPFREGVRTSLVYLTLSEELRDEHTTLSIPGMMIHEGIPGHHLQLATASMHPSVIRRHMNASEHAEGWTTMLEDYMLDVGYVGDLTDEVRFVGKRDIARIGARVAIDLFFMTGAREYLDVGVDCDLSSGDAFQAAGNLLAKVTGFVPGRVQAELNWYSQERSYPLSYLTGNRLVWKLKHDMERAQARKQDRQRLDYDFHRLYLESGNMPLSFLRRVFKHHGMID